MTFPASMYMCFMYFSSNHIASHRPAEPSQITSESQVECVLERETLVMSFVCVAIASVGRGRVSVYVVCVV